MSVSSIIGQAEKASASTTTNAYAENKEMFLQLLVAQLSNQDPLNPVEDKEFIAQLATFTQVEELQKLNEGMTSLVESYDRQQFVTATNLLGQRVLAAGTTISKVQTSKDGDFATTPIYYTSDVNLSNCVVNVYGPGGYTIYSEEVGALQAGSYTFTWDGTNSSTGAVVANGIYQFAVVAYDLNGNRVLTSNEVFGDVVQVEKTDSGYNLILFDGRTVALDDVSIAGYYLSGGSGEEEGDGGDGGDGGDSADPETEP